MLQAMQSEWDEVMLEAFTLKQALDQTRRELSQALYQHDAACRVIARLMRERDEARAMLSAKGNNVTHPQRLPQLQHLHRAPVVMAMIWKLKEIVPQPTGVQQVQK